jgi:predicted DsbA family dithiol-disulfide isomerase
MSLSGQPVKPLITIDIVSDVVCPWCYIGKRRLERAIHDLSSSYDFKITYHPFELNPTIPLQGINQKEYLTKKFGGAERYDQITTHVAEVAAAEGLSFNFDKQKVSPNTRNLHRVLELARQHGKQAEMKEAFLKAYFTDGIDLSSIENIVNVATKAGLDTDTTTALLSGTDGLAEIELAEEQMQRNGVTGVPFFIINNKYGVSGAQSSETFIKVFTEIGSSVAVNGEACAVDGSDC